MATPHVPVTGGCLCGAVRYESKQAPTQGYFCHCTICRKAYGGLFSATVTFSGAGFSLTKGALKYYRATGVAKRGFCADCGSPVAFFYAGNSTVWIKIGSLDHPEDWPMTPDASWTTPTATARVATPRGAPGCPARRWPTAGSTRSIPSASSRPRPATRWAGSSTRARRSTASARSPT